MIRTLLFLLFLSGLSASSQQLMERFNALFAEANYAQACDIAGSYVDESFALPYSDADCFAYASYAPYACFLAGDVESATALSGDILKELKRRGNKNNRVFTDAGFAYASYLAQSGDFDASAALMDSVVFFAEKNEGPQSEYVISLLYQQGALLHSAGASHKAAAVYTTLMDRARKAYPAGDSTLMTISNTVSAFYTGQGYFTESEPFFLEACSVMEKQFGKESTEYVTTLNSLGEFYIYAAWYPKAVAVFQDFVALCLKVFGKKSADYATALNNLAVALEKSERYAEARDIYLQAMEIKAKVWKKESDYYALTLCNLAVVEEALGNFAEADRLLQEAIGIYEQVYGDQHPNYATALNNLAYSYSNRGDYTKAVEIFQKALIVQEASTGKESKEYAGTLSNLALQYASLGKNSEAQQKFEEALLLQARIIGKDHPDYGTTAFNLANLMIETGDLNKAGEYLAQAIAVHNKTGQLPNAVSSYASLLQTQGRYVEAEETYRKLLPEYEQRYGARHPELATIQSNYGLLLTETGQHKKAIDLLENALGILHDAHGADHPDNIHLLTNLSNAWLGLGDLQKAEALIIQARDLSEKVQGKAHPDHATMLQNVAVVYYRIGSYAKAEGYYKQALDIYTAASYAQHRLTANLQTNWGAMLMSWIYQEPDRQKRDELAGRAYTLLKEAVRIDSIALGMDHPEMASDLNNLGELNRLVGWNEQALSFYQRSQALESRHFGENSERYAVGLSNMALCYSAMGRMDKAVSSSEKSLAIRQGLFGVDDPRTQNAWSTLASVYADNQQIARADSCYLKALDITFTSLERNFAFLSKAQREDYLRSVEDQIGQYSLFVLDMAGARPESVGGLYSSQVQYKGILMRTDAAIRKQLERAAAKDKNLMADFEDYQKLHQRRLAGDESDSLADAIAAMEKRLQQVLNGSGKSETAVNWKSVADALPAGSLLIETVMVPDSLGFRYAAIVLKKAADPVMVPLCRDSELAGMLNVTGDDRARVRQLYGTLTNADARMYNLVLKPLEPALKDAREVYLSGVGVLNRIPFHALANAAGQRLEDRMTLHMVVSTADPARQYTKPDDAYVMGGARFSAQAQSTWWNYLPGTRSEAVEVSTTLTGLKWKVALDTGALASETRFRKALEQQPAVIHLATHGFFYPDPALVASSMETESETSVDFRSGRGMAGFSNRRDAMQRSGVVFAGVNDALEAGVADVQSDGVLTAAEVEWMTLDQTGLVVLSACETGLGDVRGSEGVYGLQRSFRIAGVPRLIISLWQVPDKETREFFALFYQSYAGDGDAAKAIRHARAIMKKKYDPYYWAAFVLVE